MEARALEPTTITHEPKRFITMHTAELWWIRQARDDPRRFIQYMTGMPLAKHHELWLAHIFDFRPDSKRSRLQFVAPRESAKSTIALYALVWFIARFPFMSNAIISVSSKQAEARLGMVRDIIEHDQRFKNVFGWIKIDDRQRNTVNEFQVYTEALYDPTTKDIKPITYQAWRGILKRLGSLKDPTLYSAGAGGKGMIGRRISGLMILDDIVDESHLKESLQGQMYDYILRTLIPCLQDRAKCINIMTRWMINDVAERIKHNPEWITIEIQAIRTDENGVRYSYWPEYWPLERLERRRAELGDTMFSVMYMNDPQALTAAKFVQAGLYNKLPDPLPPLSGILVSTDFALSVKQDADWTVFAAIGYDAFGNIYILDMERIKTTPDIVVTQLGYFAHRIMDTYGRCDKVLIENVAFQSTMRFNLLDKFPHLPTDTIKPFGDKGHRTDILAAKVNNGKVYFNVDNPVHPQLVTECMNFPLYKHDDTIDALTLALQYLGVSISMAKVTFVKPKYAL